MNVMILVFWVTVILLVIAAPISGRRKQKPARNNSTISDKIINGPVASITTYPWHVHVIGNGNNQRCGGTLIDQLWVLTAGHCVSGASSLNLRFGSESCTQGGTSMTSTIFLIHPAYHATDWYNDIALIKLPSAVALSTSIALIKMIPRVKCCPPSTLSKFAFTGCGTINGPAMPLALRYTDTLVEITNYQCISTYGIGSVSPISVLCAKSTGSSTCTADDGGPLVTPTAPQLLVGILSKSPSTCVNSVVNNPSLFTRVCAYHDWLQFITGINFG